MDVSAPTVLASDIWRSIGSELIIFVLTLGFALVIRSTASRRPSTASGKCADVTGTCTVPSSPAVVKQLSTPKTLRSPVGLGGEWRQAAGTRPSTPVAPASVAPNRRAAGTDDVPQRQRSPGQLMDEIIQCVREQQSIRSACRALSLYEELRLDLKAAGVGIREAARQAVHPPVELFTTLVQCAVRAGRHHLVESLMEDMVEAGVARNLAFYESAMKQLAGQKQYHLALAVYDRLVADGLQPSAVTCSCLIGFAAEVGELQRAVEFFDRLSKLTTPSIRAYMTVLRVHAKRQDWNSSVELLHDMENRGVKPDSLALNVVLATGVAAEKMDAVAELVAEADRSVPPTSDVVSYNTLIKGYAQRGAAAEALKAIARMRARGLQPNAITYNTAMDAAVRGGQSAEAWNLLREMRGANLRPDKFTCSILVKSLAQKPTADQVQRALTLLDEVGPACDSNLRSSLYHAVLDAASQAPDAGAGCPPLPALVFAQMRSQKVTPSPQAQRLLLQAMQAQVSPGAPAMPGPIGA